MSMASKGSSLGRLQRRVAGAGNNETITAFVGDIRDVCAEHGHAMLAGVGSEDLPGVLLDVPVADLAVIVEPKPKPKPKAAPAEAVKTDDKKPAAKRSKRVSTK